MQISQGLVDPNQSRNSSEGKGKTVNIPLLFKYAWQHKFGFRRFGIGQYIKPGVLTKASLGSIVMMRTRLNLE